MKTREQIKIRIVAIQSEIETLKFSDMPLQMQQTRILQKQQHILLLQWVLADDNKPPKL